MVASIRRDTIRFSPSVELCGLLTVRDANRLSQDYYRSLTPQQKSEMMVLFTKHSAEKVTRSKSWFISIPSCLSSFYIAFLSKVRPLLLKPYKGGKFNPLYLWVNCRGEAMEHDIFTKEVKVIVQLFNPFLRVTPIDWRRMTVTDLFRGVMDNPFRTMDDLVKVLSIHLNVGLSVMEEHYNR